MRPKVSRGIKSTESTKNLAILGNKGTKQQDSFLIEELDLCRLNSKKETINGINTCRTEISNSNYTSRTNQSDKRILQPLHFVQNRKTYAEIQKEKNLYRKSYLSRNNSKSRILQIENQQNRFQKPISKQYEQISTIDIEILKILEQQNIQCKEVISSLKKQLQQKDLSYDFLRKTNEDLQKKIYETQRQFLWLQQNMRNKQKEILEKNNQFQILKKQLDNLQIEFQRKDTHHHSRKVSFQQPQQEIGKLKNQNDLLHRQQQTYKNELRNIRKENVEYRREIAKMKRQLIEREENWIEMGQRSSIRIAQGIKSELKQFGEQRLKHYEQMLRSSKQQIEFLRQKNVALQGKLQTIKQKQIKELICLKKSLQKPSHREQDKNDSTSYKKTHLKSRSMAVLEPYSFLATQQDSLF